MHSGFSFPQPDPLPLLSLAQQTLLHLDSKPLPAILGAEARFERRLAWCPREGLFAPDFNAYLQAREAVVSTRGNIEDSRRELKEALMHAEERVMKLNNAHEQVSPYLDMRVARSMRAISRPTEADTCTHTTFTERRIRRDDSS